MLCGISNTANTSANTPIDIIIIVKIINSFFNFTPPRYQYNNIISKNIKKGG
jgi:hypothetical protein